jgi:FecR protein
MKWWQRSIAPGFIAGTFAIVLGSISAIAQSDLLTQAEIYKLVNRVQLLLKNQPPRSAQVADVVEPLDAVKTATRARADLVFNEGSLVRLGGNAIFRFVPGSRSFQLRNGTGLFIFPPGDEMGTVVTPEAVVTAPGTTVWVQHNSDKQTTSIGVLTENPQVPVTVATPKGDGTVVLDAGQRTDVKKGELTAVKDMSLRRFYKVCQLAADLGTETEIPSDSLPPQAQNTIVAVRNQAFAALEEQFRQETDPPHGFEQIVPCSVKEEPKDISTDPQHVFQGFPATSSQR